MIKGIVEAKYRSDGGHWYFVFLQCAEMIKGNAEAKYRSDRGHWHFVFLQCGEVTGEGVGRE